MKAVILNGASPTDTHVHHLHHLIVTELQQIGWDVDGFTLHDNKIAYCVGCFKCWIQTPGECIAKDDHRDINAAVINSDALILLTPVVFGSYSAELKRMMDHFIPLIMPFFQRIDGETHHEKRYASYPDLFGIGVQAQANAAQADIFHRLVRRNAINMHANRCVTAVWQHSDSDDDMRSRLRALLTDTAQTTPTTPTTPIKEAFA